MGRRGENSSRAVSRGTGMKKPVVPGTLATSGVRPDGALEAKMRAIVSHLLCWQSCISSLFF